MRGVVLADSGPLYAATDPDDSLHERYLQEKERLAAESLGTEARLTMEQEGGGWTIKAVALSLRGRAPGVDEAEFRRLAEVAKANCPVSKVLNAAITLEVAFG